MEICCGEYLFTDDKSKIHLEEVCHLLRQSHWAQERPVEIIGKSIEGSLCFSVFHQDVQIGFARVVTDYAVYSLILDVIIDNEYRGKGLGKKLVDFMIDHPDIKDTSFALWTKYAEGLYDKCGFQEESGYIYMFKRPERGV
ncbi:MAG: GNAT family N-acetyltransferase [Bacillota bacterium]